MEDNKTANFNDYTENADRSDDKAQKKMDVSAFSSVAKGISSIINNDTPKNRRTAKARPVWKPEYGYHNRALRRKYTNLRDQDTLTKTDIIAKISPLEKWFTRISDNIHNGKLRHEAFLNDLVSEDMAMESARKDRMLNSFVEKFGNAMGKAMYEETLRLQSIEFDKKILRG